MFFHRYNTLPSKVIFLFLGIVSLTILSTTFLMEYGFKIPTCHMCVLERYPYLSASVLSFSLYFIPPGTLSHGIFKYCLFSAFLTSTLLSSYHIGLEHGGFELPSFCKPAPLSAHSVEVLREKIMNQKTVIPCNAIPIRIFFLSLAEWNGLISLVLLGISWKNMTKK